MSLALLEIGRPPSVDNHPIAMRMHMKNIDCPTLVYARSSEPAKMVFSKPDHYRFNMSVSKSFFDQKMNPMCQLNNSMMYGGLEPSLHDNVLFCLGKEHNTRLLLEHQLHR